MWRLKQAVNLGEKRGYIVKALAFLVMALFLLACGATPPTLKTVPVATGSPPSWVLVVDVTRISPRRRQERKEKNIKTSRPLRLSGKKLLGSTSNTQQGDYLV
jgi:uncharacterized lipoprotein YajG